MEKLFWTKTEIDSAQFEVIEIITSLKQVSLLINFHLDQQKYLALFRPEKTLKIDIDPTIPRPLELYLDCTFSNLCNSFGWDQFPPVIPWSLDSDDKGVLRPYWKVAKPLNIYELKRDNLLKMNSKLWKTVAVADYVFGVGDRVSNDCLQTEDGIKVVDSGFSFIPGTDLPSELSIIRKNLEGESISDDQELLTSLTQIPEIIVEQKYLTEENRFWVIQRAENLLFNKFII